jgi:D-beta-D-heptose 7-phosphate kinase/D-beta-D-heptose 1-phosphate adenosyltransferase
MRETLAQFKNARILCSGDIMLDRFIRGSVDRISPEAPVPILKYAEETMMLGGAGNVIANLCSLGCAAAFVGVVGQDREGDLVQSLLEACGSTCDLLRLEASSTIVKTRFVSDNNHMLRFDRETVEPLSDDNAAVLLAKIERALPHCDLVLLSDYAKGLLTDHFVQGVIRLCRQQGKRVMIDPKGRDYAKYRGAFLLKPNRKELELASDAKLNAKSPHFIQDVSRAAKAVAERVDVEHVIVTLGDKGMLHVASKGKEEPLHLPTFAKEVFDVSGAGDTSFAVLGASLAAGASLSDAMRLANSASGIVVGKFGTATVNCDDLLACLHEQAQGDRSCLRKIVTREELARQIASLHKDGLQVGFINGCFDLLHLGHLDSLWQAKGACDFLVVAVNSDQSVKRIKGESRPIQDEGTRSVLLASLECVDRVVLFDEDTAMQVVDDLRPDVIAKEGYALENWPEAQHVLAYGGKAVTLKRREGYSTTQIVQRIKSATP